MKNKLEPAFINSCHHVVSEIPQLFPIRIERNMVAWSDLFSDGFKHPFGNIQLSRDDMADVRQLCTPVHALLTPRSGQPVRYCPWHCGHCTKPLPYRSSLELGDQTTVQDHPRLSTAVHEKNVFPNGWCQKHICQTQIFQEAASSVPMSWEAACSATERRSKHGAAGPCSRFPPSWTSVCLLPGNTAWCGKKTPKTFHYPKGRWSVSCQP